jgi:AcrR family transcriptional regulator
VTATRRSGRRPGDSGTREAILAAARSYFGAGGYSGTTIRGVARAAGVDPALVHHYFGSKDQLFAAALELPVDPTVLVHRLLADGPAGVGERVVRTFVEIWDATPGQGPMLALLRTAVSDERAAASLRDFLTHVLLGPLAAGAGSDQPQLRAGLAAAQMLGLAVARYVIGLEPVAGASPEVLSRAVGPTIQRYLTGDLG